ncbi:MAG: GAF domain-containing protein [Microcoleus vaginatus WJT46-NPBG5]|jgi:GAF domain-containing protein|nr:GAF domain-containing protein [Microcoleus vaginatus WJT46-NPBG5]
MADPSLQKITDRLSKTLTQDKTVQETTNDLRKILDVDRVILYYFYLQWRGQVTFESLSSPQLSVFGMRGADDCFNGEYAALYEAGRVRAIPDIELEPIHPCHRDFLRSIQVRANLVVPVLNFKGLWGLLIAHHCCDPRVWLPADIEMMKKAAENLANASSIRDS